MTMYTTGLVYRSVTNRLRSVRLSFRLLPGGYSDDHRGHRCGLVPQLARDRDRFPGSIPSRVYPEYHLCSQNTGGCSGVPEKFKPRVFLEYHRFRVYPIQRLDVRMASEARV